MEKAYKIANAKVQILKILHTKYLQKMPKIMQNLQKCPKLPKKRENTFNKTSEKREEEKMHSCEKLAHAARPLRSYFSISAQILSKVQKHAIRGSPGQTQERTRKQVARIRPWNTMCAISISSNKGIEYMPIC